MIAWMGWAMALGALAYATAWSLDIPLRRAGVATRMLWAGAIALTVLVPAGLASRPRPALPAPGTWRVVTIGPTQGPAEPVVATGRLASNGGRIRRDDLVLRAWGLATVVCLLWLVRGQFGTARRRRSWREAVLDGVPVLVAPADGPAVVGVLRPTVVVPRWLLDASPSHRAMILEHEREHVVARDPLFLFSLRLCRALMPWNPALWALVWRARAAMELDCDARVLRGGADAHSYGAMLLALARHAGRRGAPAPALLEAPSLLERRITAMTTPQAPLAARRLLPMALVAVLLIVAGCAMPRPTALGPTRSHAIATDAVGDPSSRLVVRDLAAVPARAVSVTPGEPTRGEAASLRDPGVDSVEQRATEPAAPVESPQPPTDPDPVARPRLDTVPPAWWTGGVTEVQDPTAAARERTRRTVAASYPLAVEQGTGDRPVWLLQYHSGGSWYTETRRAPAPSAYDRRALGRAAGVREADIARWDTLSWRSGDRADGPLVHTILVRLILEAAQPAGRFSGRRPVFDDDYGRLVRRVADTLAVVFPDLSRLPSSDTARVWLVTAEDRMLEHGRDTTGYAEARRRHQAAELPVSYLLRRDAAVVRILWLQR